MARGFSNSITVFTKEQGEEKLQENVLGRGGKSLKPQHNKSTWLCQVHTGIYLATTRFPDRRAVLIKNLKYKTTNFIIIWLPRQNQERLACVIVQVFRVTHQQ